MPENKVDKVSFSEWEQAIETSRTNRVMLEGAEKNLNLLEQTG